ncbi:NAD-dependent epimerase/dehydratase family protein [Fuerstiella marisgermanici]|uniref:Cholesterol dehydrogenase n=1 Tax=Fuerstiella marisgermanici TaxID=1891926 RepID=A0A1P8WFP5_9PLAN|nr:NAD(P)H-binding protein [Fuerstiella marisgermanici]APZ92863.1 Cholesterol dehydrogenase [Fuerstiella marisgermanici]
MRWPWGTGYIGTPLVKRLLQSDAIDEVNCLIRTTADSDRFPSRSLLRYSVGDITQPAAYAGELKQCDTLIHMAAATGKVSKAEHWRVNCEGTKNLVDASVAAGIRHFIFISSIAAGYPDNKYYHYAQAKSAAEQYVLNSPLQATVVRPTIVTGHDAPVTQGLRKLRMGRLLLLFGTGEVCVQPVSVSDLVEVLHEVTLQQPTRQIIEVGGKDVLTLRRFIECISSPDSKPLIPIPIPLRPARFLLAMMEPAISRWLPLTAGQLALFRNNSTAATSDVGSTHEFMSLEELVAQCHG